MPYGTRSIRLVLHLLGFSAFTLGLQQVAAAAPLETELATQVETLSKAWVNRYPMTGFKQGLAVLPIEEKTDRARSQALGTTVRELVSGQIVKSQVFFLVDRDSLNRSLQEAELSLSGVVDERSMVQAGKIAGVRAFISGSISESGTDYAISLKIIDAETGTVLAVDTAAVPASRLSAARRQLAYEAIEKYGLGLNVQYNQMFLRGPLTPASSSLTDIYVNYRPMLWLNFKLGITNLSLQYEQGDLRESQIFPAAPASGSSTYLYTGRPTISATTMMFGFDYNQMITPWFSLGLGLTFNMFERPMMQQVFGSGWYDDDPSATVNYVRTVTGFRVNHYFKSVAMMRVELKPQFYVLPRLTIAPVVGIILAENLSTEYSEIGSDLYGSDAPERITKYGNIRRTNLLDGKNVEDITFNMAWTAGLAVNFFF